MVLSHNKARPWRCSASKLGLSEEIDVNRRVKAVLLYLAAG